MLKPTVSTFLFRLQDQTVSTIGFPRSVWVLLETLVSAVHYTYMREYWLQGRKFDQARQ